MRWINHNPQEGDKRYICKFLWMPLTLPRPDGVLETRVLEKADIEQTYSKVNETAGDVCIDGVYCEYTHAKLRWVHTQWRYN